MPFHKSFSKPRTIVYVFFTIGLAIYMIDIFSSCSSPATPSAIPKSAEDYMGTENCKSCHELEHENWSGSHHDLSMQEANSNTILADFNDTSFDHMGLTSRFFKRDGKYYVHTEGPDGNMDDFEVKYTFGVEPLQQYMIEFPGGRLQCLLAAWDSEKNEWFQLNPNDRFAPDDWMHWSRGSMTWNTMCADCHSTYLEKKYDEPSDSFQTDWAIINVSCEACHGPGKTHVKYIESSDYTKGKNVVEDSYMFQTLDLSGKELTDQCARCHALRSQITRVYDHSGEFMDHYLPNLITPPMYYPDGQILEEDYVYGSFLQSRMYHRGVKCTDCHDPHTTKVKLEGNVLCQQCHLPDKYDTPAHHFHENGTESAMCINCHMTGQVYMGNDYRRDHSFRIPRPDQSVLYDTPNACIQCHTEESDKWAAEAIVEWYGPKRKAHYSDIFTKANSGDIKTIPDLMKMTSDTAQTDMVRATAVWLLGEFGDPVSRPSIISALSDSNALVRHTAVRVLDRFNNEDKIRYLPDRLHDSVRTVRTQAVYSLAGSSVDLLSGDDKVAHEDAMQEYQTALDMQADFPIGRLARGQYYHKKGDLERAEQSYQAANAIDPYLIPAYNNLANLYYQLQKLQQAEETFKRILEIEPDQVDANYSLGLLLAEKSRLVEAETYLKTAAEVSGIPRYYYNLGLVQQNLQRPKDAEATYLKALTIDPNSEANLYALTILRIQQNDQVKALESATRLLEISPENQNYVQLMNSLR